MVDQLIHWGIVGAGALWLLGWTMVKLGNWLQGHQRTVKSIDDLVAVPARSPLPISVIPNYMGINLCSVRSLEWVRQRDSQLVSLTINFIPAKDQ